MGARSKTTQPNNLPEFRGRSKVRKTLDTTEFRADLLPVVAPNNSNYCSVLDPNCKKPGPVANYLSFLACEYNDTIEQITDHEDGQGTNSPSATPAAKLMTIPLLVYGIVGPTKPWVKVTSTATLSSIMLGTAAHANNACSPSFFGN
jgi:hypothetical protein